MSDNRDATQEGPKENRRKSKEFLDSPISFVPPVLPRNEQEPLSSNRGGRECARMREWKKERLGVDYAADDGDKE